MGNKSMSQAKSNTTIGSLVPSKEILHTVLEEFSDMIYLPSGGIDVTSSTGGAYNIFEPGVDEAHTVEEFEGVIFMSHRYNVYIPDASSIDGDNNLFCGSMDGVTGKDQKYRFYSCSLCPLNQHWCDKDGDSTTCNNTRLLYIIREGHVLPDLLYLPFSAFEAYNDYRTAISESGKKVHGVITKFSINKTKCTAGYIIPKFEAIRDLSLGEEMMVRKYKNAMLKSNLRTGIAANSLGATKDIEIRALLLNEYTIVKNNDQSDPSSQVTA